MAGGAFSGGSDRGFSLPAFERLAPPPPPDAVAARIDGLTRPGDVVIDLFGRGGWVARSAVDRQRRAVSIESSPLTRLLAELVLRPPDLRHLDAAFQSLSAAPRGDTSLRLSIGRLFASHCPTCGRAVVLDEMIWERSGSTGPEDGAGTVADVEDRPVRRHFRCIACRDQLGGGEARHADPDAADLARAAWRPPDDHVRKMLRDRFPVLDGGDRLIDDLLDLHTPRQLDGLAAILARIEGDLRAAAVAAALRLALLHALLPASRLSGYPGRIAAIRVANGRVRPPAAGQWRERNPWLAFEDGIRIIRGFLQRLESLSPGSVQARFGDDYRTLVEGAATVNVRLGTPGGYRSLARDAADLRRTGPTGVSGPAGSTGAPGARLVVGQPPLRPSQERLAFSYLATGWLLGREAAALLPLEPLFGATTRVPWGWQASAVRRGLEAVAPLLARDARAVLFVADGGPEAIVAAALGAAGAGYRLVAARQADTAAEVGGSVELTVPGAPLPPGPRSRANRSLEPVPGGRGDPDIVPGAGLFGPPERFDQRPFADAEAALTVTEIAVAALRARGEPASEEQLLGEILVGLDRAGHLRRLAAGTRETAPGAADVAADRATGGSGPADALDRGARRSDSIRAFAGAARLRSPTPTPTPTATAADPVERLVHLIRAELGQRSRGRLAEIEPGRWWLADDEDRETAAAPLADRVEWAVYSLLSTAGPLSEAAFLERIAGLFRGHDLPDEPLVRACLESYRSPASTPDRLVTNDDLLQRTHEHGEILALLADTGHRMGFGVWLGRREQARIVAGRRLSERLEARERDIHLPAVARAPADALEDVDCIWYVRGRLAFMFAVEWTAMLDDPVFRVHGRIPPADNLVRFIVVAPERTELVRHKIERSPLLRAALAAGGWHVIKSNHLRAFAALDAPTLAELEPFLGLDPLVERSAEQMPLFDR